MDGDAYMHIHNLPLVHVVGRIHVDKGWLGLGSSLASGTQLWEAGPVTYLVLCAMVRFAASRPYK